jgi:serine phosphatase RsbU (regulator of sigma subunit)
LTHSLHNIRWRLVISSAVALLLALGFFVLHQWVYAPSDDQCFWRIQGHKVTIQEILPGGVAENAGLLEGDELLMIQGRRVDPMNLLKMQKFINDQPRNRVLLYTVRGERSGEKRVMRMPISLVKPFDNTTLIVLLSGLVAWGMGLLVVISSPQRKIARHFYYLGVATLLMTVVGNRDPLAFPLPLALPGILVSGLVTGLLPALLLHFFLRFPHPFALRLNRRFLAALYGVSLAGGLLTIAAGAIFAMDKGETFQEFLEFMTLARVGQVLDLLGTLVLVGAAVVFGAGVSRLSSRRRRALLPALIFTVGILADMLVYRVLSIQASGQSLLFDREKWIFCTPLPLLPLSFAYAIFRHGLFDVRKALLRWITYFLVLGLTLAVYLGALSFVFSEGVQALPAGWVGVLVALSALPVGWLLRFLLLKLRRVFRRDLTTARDLILGSLRETRRRFSSEALLAGLVDSLREAFRPQVLLVLPVEGNAVLLPPVADPDPEDPCLGTLAQPLRFQLPPGILRQARENQELVLGVESDEAEWIREQGPDQRAHLDGLGAQILVLIMANDEPLKVLLLGGKYAELGYGREDRELLREVAISAGTLLETALLHRRLLDQGRIEQELQTARLIQESLITSKPPVIPGFQMALRLEPALETGGDLLWVGRRPSGRWIAAVGDVSGKGLAAALYMSQATALLMHLAQQETPFAEFLPSMDETLRSLMGSKDFLTLCLLEWDERGHFLAGRAGHPPPILVQGAGPQDALEWKVQGRGLGLRPAGRRDWEVKEGVLGPRQWLVMYSDGLTEAMNKRGELYGCQRLQERVQHFWGTGSVRAACEGVFQDVASFEHQNRDDRTLLLLARDVP